MTSLVPPPPDDSYLRALNATTARAIEVAEPLTSPYPGAPEVQRASVAATLREREPELVALSRDLHAHPELGFEEERSVAAVARLLRSADNDATVGVGGLPTALIATAGASGPHVAVLAEYDALPGIGHGCGHNIICASAVGGFLGAASVVANTGGRVSLIGTPAEEGGGGKETLAAAGVFDDVDAVVMVHPFSHDIALHPFLGRRHVEMIFRGVAAHAAAQPFMGRNALDAAVAAYQGVAALRQHLPDSDRVHGIVTDGGSRANVVPERAALEFAVRSAQPETLRDLAQRMVRIADAAAAMHGCTVELIWDAQPAYLPIRFNTTLAARWTQHQATRGRQSLPPGVVPETLTGSTDLGNLSYRLPAIHPMIAIGHDQIALHSAEFAAAAGSESGDRAVVDAAFGLAMTAVDYLADAELRAAAHAEFEAAGGSLDVSAFFS